ncbi:MAG: LutC/YkgG family protein [Planctomycetota bacterium]|jgi:L-lactate dehydrogenase complex protein LldG
MMPGTSQKEFFKQIKAALTDRGQPVDLPDDLEIARVISTQENLIEIFITNAKQAGMNAYRLPNEKTAVDKIIAIIQETGGKNAIITNENMPAREQLIQALKQKGIQLKDPDDQNAAFDAEFGITGADAAIAETASLCINSGDQKRRLASLAVPNHIAVIRANQIIPDLLDWTQNQPTNLPANTVLISAPSKTADIEMILVLGVHGPKEEHIIIIE